jgi:hypothetical protein
LGKGRRRRRARRYTSAAVSTAAATAATSRRTVRRRWEERNERSGAECETGRAAKDEMLAGAVGCGDESPATASAPAGVVASPTSGVCVGVGGAAPSGRNGKNGAGALSSGKSGSCSSLLLR